MVKYPILAGIAVKAGNSRLNKAKCLFFSWNDWFNGISMLPQSSAWKCALVNNVTSTIHGSGVFFCKWIACLTTGIQEKKGSRRTNPHESGFPPVRFVIRMMSG